MEKPLIQSFAWLHNLVRILALPPMRLLDFPTLVYFNQAISDALSVACLLCRSQTFLGQALLGHLFTIVYYTLPVLFLCRSQTFLGQALLE
jgi:hypothetical protein